MTGVLAQSYQPGNSDYNLTLNSLKFFFLLLLFNEFYYIQSCTTVITTQFYSISILNPQHLTPPHNLSHMETINFSKSVSQYLLYKEVHCVLFLDSTYKWQHVMLVSHCLTNFIQHDNFQVHPCCYKCQYFFHFNG